MTNFYVLVPDEGVRYGTKWAYAERLEPIIQGEPVRCPVCGDPVTEQDWLPPRRIRLSSARREKWGDFVWGAGLSLLASGRFRTIYDAERLTGLSFVPDPVEIVQAGRYKNGDLPPSLPTYYVIKALWSGGNQDDVASGVVRKRPARCPYCRVGDGSRLKQSGIVVEEGSWMGADAFRVRGESSQIVVSERFKQVVERYHLKNARVVPAEKYAYDERRVMQGSLWYVRED